jgi:hypothetical protein
LSPFEELPPSPPLQAAPLLLAIGLAQKEYKELRLFVVELRKIRVEIRTRKLRAVPFVIKNLLVAEMGSESLCDLFDTGPVLPRK